MIRFLIANKIGVINVHALALLPIGVILKLLFNAKLIYDAHELETEVENLGGLKKTLCKFLEKRLICKVDATFVVSESIACWYREHYVSCNPVVVLNVPIWTETTHSRYFHDYFNFLPTDKVFLYQGNLGLGRGIELLIKTFEAYKKPEAKLVFMGYGPLLNTVNEASQLNKNIFFHPAVSPNVLLQYTAAADVGLSIIEETCLSYSYCMPNKLFEYAMSGVPVIVSNRIEMASFVNANSCGWILDEETTESLSKLINKAIKCELTKIGQKGRKATKAVAWDVQEQKMITAFTSICEGK